MAVATDLGSGFVFAEGDVEPSISGSFSFGTAATQDIQDLSGSVGSWDPLMVDQSPVLGFWPGAANNYGAFEVLTTIPGVDPAPFMSGSWLGSNANWAANGAPLEVHDKSDVPNDEHTRLYEGINEGEYNPFPIPAGPPEELQRIRDATRFQKAYSFHRHQPVRIRVFKR